MKIIKPYLQNLLFTIPVIIFTLYSCASKPNIPYPGRMSENFAKLEQWNPLLASEIRKLPEFQDGVAIQEEKALDDLVELYAENPKVFSNAFKQMYQVGIPEVRKYCSPLQALFWLAEDGKQAFFEDSVSNCSLDKLLDNAWNVATSNFDSFIEKEAEKVISSCTDDEILKLVDKHMEQDFDGTTSQYIISLAKKYPDSFVYHPSDRIIYTMNKSMKSGGKTSTQWLID